jgi:hypothetical protein
VLRTQKLREIFVRTFGILTMAGLLCVIGNGCAHSSGVIPVSNTRTALNDGRFVTALFEKAKGRVLKDADYDQYIDPSVTGADRALARKLMKLMPANARGDFVYYDPNTGRLISNNRDLVRQAVVTRGWVTDKPRPVTPTITQSIARSPRVHYVDSCSPKDPYTGSGPYYRMVSKCGFAGGLGVVNIPCNSSYMPSGDSGYVYFELANGARSDSYLIEGGLNYNSDYYNTSDPQHTGIVPYFRSTFGQQYTNLNETGFHYSCTLPFMIAHGMVNAPASTSKYTYTYTAQLGPDFNPFAFWQGTKYLDFQHPFWAFYGTPTSLDHPSVDAANVPTPCSTCSISRVTSIAQPIDRNDGAYFGTTNSGSQIHWAQVEFGEWLTGCQENGSGWCYFSASRNSQRYYGGEESWSPFALLRVIGPTQSGFGPWETYDGITTYSSLYANSDVQAGGDFSSVTTPSCTADSYGYCIAWDSGYTDNGDYGSDAWGNRCQYWTPLSSESWYIETPTEVLQQVSHSVVDDGTQSCSSIDQWTPYEPSVEFGDPNLP